MASGSMSPSVIYEDNHLLVLAKPACMPSVPDRTGDVSLLDWGKSYLRQTRGKKGNVFLAVLHRLDRPVSGVMVFACTSKAARRMSEQIRQGRVRKDYLAVVEGRPDKDSGFSEQLLLKDRKLNRVRILEKSDPGSRVAKTEWRVLSGGDRSVLRLRPLTGRSHQLRVLCASMGCPISGDVKYGAPEPLPHGAIALHAALIRFRHPVGDREPSFQVEPPGLFRKLAGFRLEGEKIRKRA